MVMVNTQKKKKADYISWNKIQIFILKSKKDGLFEISLFVCLSSFFAMRISNVLELKWSDILYKEQFTLTEVNKLASSSKKPVKRTITIVDDVQEHIKYCYYNMRIKNPNQLIFLSNRTSTALSNQGINKRIKKLFKKYNISFGNLSSESFRKSFGKKIAEDYNYTDEVFKKLGQLYHHKDKNITINYLGIDKNKLPKKKEIIKNIYTNVTL